MVLEPFRFVITCISGLNVRRRCAARTAHYRQHLELWYYPAGIAAGRNSWLMKLYWNLPC